MRRTDQAVEVDFAVGQRLISGCAIIKSITSIRARTSLEAIE
jgi:hypothetical protein